MQLNFAKYQAAGNDFIIIDNFQDQHYTYSPVLTKQLCHRQFGIGADGIISIEKKQVMILRCYTTMQMAVKVMGCVAMAVGQRFTMHKC